ncbi:UNVERIFIED_CONTAM: Retrovirus-related Pol polyprotein from transposon RE1 [Sesamum radiatum]|uniref:Retrovirus-related Pol polyprotein from transposon RE1 n=1 Tax=Sesamum radiatum TaxID=300843 RepID=A0AAW2T4L4_SESRA
MILRVEKQRRVNMEYADVTENSAMCARGQDYRQKHFVKKRGIMVKKSMTCDYCNKMGHGRDTCFRLHGVPDWYKELNEQKKKGPVTRAYAAAETENIVNTINSQGDNLVSDLLEALKTIQNNKLTRDPMQVHFAQDMEMTGHVLISTDTLDHTHIPSTSTDPIPSIYISADSLADAEPVIDTAPVLPPRRSLKQPKTRAWLADFPCNLPFSSLITPDTLASSHVEFLAVLSTFQEPCSYKEAQGCPEWEEAMRQELAALEQNDTWEADGSIDRYKARLVAKGYNQVEGVDYIDRFSPVAKAVTVRVFLALASSYSWPVHQVDINNAFLHSFLDEDIYMQAPAGYAVPKGKVCKLKRSLYNLKQASRQWNLELTAKLLGFGFH